MARPSKVKSLLVLVLAVGLLGCLMNEDPQSAPETGELAEARVDVRNNNWLDMAIYAENGSLRVRIGTVTGMDRQMLAIPAHLLASTSGFRLIASPLGSNDKYATYPVDIWPGDTVQFRIENNLRNSNISTW